MTNANASTSTATAVAAAASPARKRLWLMALPLLASAAGAAWWLMTPTPDLSDFLRGVMGSGKASPRVSDPVFVPLEPFTVNLQPNGRARFLHTAVTLKVPDAAAQALLVKYLPEVRSRVLAVLANREGEALMLPEQKGRLARDIQLSLELPMAPGLKPQPITSVMFTTFMLQ